MWDGDPVSLHPHAPVESAKRYVDLIGADEDPRRGQAGVRRRRLPVGRRDPAQPGLRRARQPGREEPAGRRLRADGLPDRGPQWRGIFLTAARGTARRSALEPSFATASPDTILAMPIDILFDFAAVHIIGDKAADTDLRIDFAFTDLDQTWTVWVTTRRAQRPRSAPPRTPSSPSPDPRPRWSASSSNPPRRSNSPRPGKIQLDGDASALAHLGRRAWTSSTPTSTSSPRSHRPTSAASSSAYSGRFP